MKTASPKRRRKAAETPTAPQGEAMPAPATEAPTGANVSQPNGDGGAGAEDANANGAGGTLGAVAIAVVEAAPVPATEVATDANVAQTNGKAEEQIQAAIDELVRRYGSNLRAWSGFPAVIAEAGLAPKDVSDERLARASLRLHQRDERFREDAKAANADPNNRLKIVLKGDPEFDPTFHSPANKENVMSEKKKNRKPKTPKAEATPKAKKAKEAPAKTEGGMSALDAAVRVLTETGQPMNCKELIEVMAAKGYWTSPGGKTPEATLSAAIGSEIRKKGAASRFTKTAPGRYALAHP